MDSEEAQSIVVPGGDSGESTIQFPDATCLLQPVPHVVRQKSLRGEEVADNVRIAAVEDDIGEAVLLNDVPEDGVHGGVLLLVRHQNVLIAAFPAPGTHPLCHMQGSLHLVLVQVLGELGAHALVRYVCPRICQSFANPYLNVCTAKYEKERVCYL